MIDIPVPKIAEILRPQAWHIYRLSDGVFTGDRYSGPARALDDNTPEGCGAYGAPASLQTHRWRVDVLTGDLVEYVPPQPADDTMRTWSWDAQQWRWVAAPTAAALAGQARARRNQLLAATDWVALRSMGAGEPVPVAWRQYRQALRNLPNQPGFPESIAWPQAPEA